MGSEGGRVERVRKRAHRKLIIRAEVNKKRSKPNMGERRGPQVKFG